ncbi:hypothetical protein [Niastella populi]|uniref:Uncharacterized protein n=1 Tax=Niastella populi TaxID=550983 RepID=A0A1V9FDN3_9BACT|nr:hypothetical protein [Niastella populi]OQP56473.1 hypothetical protein A4R26_04760 [Niastella populi]
MKELLLTRTGKIAVSIMVISLLLIIICRLVLLLMMKTNSLSEVIFTTCYVLIYASVFLFPAAAITLIVMSIMKRKK